MSWMPDPTVNINGIDYTGRTIGQVNVTRGRRDVYSDPRAGFATIDLIDVDAGSLGFNVGASIQVKVRNSTGTYVPLFTGRVSDWTAEVIAAQGVPVVAYRVQAVGPLAILNRRNVLFDGRPSETDGERVFAAINAGLPVVWDEYSATQTWAQVPAELIWDDVDPGYRPDLIDPGVYTLTALPARDTGYTALEVTSRAAQSAKGLLYETADGFIGYADADRRPANAQAGFLNVPFNTIAANGLTLSSSLADIINRVTIEYGEDEALTESDNFSIGQFGLQETLVRTTLASQSDAEARADDILFAQALPSTELESVTVNLRSDITDTLRDALLTIEANDAVRVSGLPNKLGFPSFGFRGFAEGITYRITDFTTSVSLFVSDENLSFGSVLWGQVPDNITFTNVNPTLTWEDARRVTT